MNTDVGLYQIIILPDDLFWKYKYDHYFDVLVQDYSISMASALEMLQSCTKPSILHFISSLDTEMAQDVEIDATEIRKSISHCHYHSWWWPGDTRSQGISNNGYDTKIHPNQLRHCQWFALWLVTILPTPPPPKKKKPKKKRATKQSTKNGLHILQAMF